MGGLILIFVFFIWLAIVALMTKFITKKMPKSWWRLPVSVGLFFVLLVLPVMDEIVGGWQFRQLCNENASIQVDRKSAVGKTVYLAETPDVEIKGTWVRVVLQPWRYVEVETDEPVVSFNTLRARGGIFFRRVSGGGVPMTFKGSCALAQKGKADIFTELGITQVQRSSIKQKDL
jgi:hypothetical protein